MTTRPEPTRSDSLHLISGHATETLSQAERRHLYSAALEDQEVFDRLVGEESWRQIFSSPGVRQELLEALAEPAPEAGIAPEDRRSVAPKSQGSTGGGGLRAWLDGLWRPQKEGGRYLPSMAMGAVAAALLAVALIPRWLELGMTAPVSPGDGPPSVAVPTTDEAPPTELAVKGYNRQHGTAGDASEFVAKSFGGSDPEATDAPRPATRGLTPKSTGSGYLNLSYALELNQPRGPRLVPGSHAFRPGDQFRLRLGADATVWLYLFNRAAGDAVYTVLYPQTASEHGPLAPSQRDVLLPADVWLTMDDTPEDEQLVLVASTQAWPLAAGREALPASELDAALERAEGSLESLNWRRSEAGDRVQLTIEESDGLVVVLRLLGG